MELVFFVAYTEIVSSRYSLRRPRIYNDYPIIIRTKKNKIVEYRMRLIEMKIAQKRNTHFAKLWHLRRFDRAG